LTQEIELLTEHRRLSEILHRMPKHVHGFLYSNPHLLNEDEIDSVSMENLEAVYQEVRGRSVLVL
jgi:hypothetical protein